MCEMIISNYDTRYWYSVAIDSVVLPKEKSYDIVREFDFLHDNEIPQFMEKYECNRLIVCCDGCIEIYTR